MSATVTFSLAENLSQEKREELLGNIVRVSHAPRYIPIDRNSSHPNISRMFYIKVSDEKLLPDVVGIMSDMKSVDCIRIHRPYKLS